jgi:hypothetical protein
MYLRLVGQEDASPANASISGWSTRSLVASDPRAPRVAESGSGVRPR